MADYIAPVNNKFSARVFLCHNAPIVPQIAKEVKRLQ